MYVTNASATKSLSPEEVAPTERYLSDRVWWVKERADKDGEDFAVLSGEFGLLTDTSRIPPYEHTLGADEIETLGDFVANQLKQKKASRVTFWAIPEEVSQGRSVNKYIAVLSRACEIAGIPLEVLPIDEPLGGRTKGKPTPVSPQYIGGPFKMNKKGYLLRAQDEKGLWQNVRTSVFLPDLQIKARMLVKKFPDRKVEIVEEQRDERFPF